ncbi:MAG: AMP-binding protein [Planctomycetales bacterium]|nr:AMP-binding protein [Planctomycetales bacterium]
MTRLFCDEFDRIVAARLGHVAIEQDGDRRCSYEQLQAMTFEIANQLHDAGVVRQSVIAIEIEKSIEYVASLIAVWRLSCIAVPLPAVFPDAARASMRARSGVAATLRLDSDRSPVVIPTATAPQRDLADGVGDAAYIFFTSGSTGVPKGVLVSHRGLVAVLFDQIAAFQMDGRTRSLFYLSTCFDASLSDIGTALLCGGTLVIESDIQWLSVTALFERLGQRRITYADLPPAIVARAAKLEIELPAELSAVVVGGEVCAPAGIDWFSQRLNLFNVYGPTEATICTSIASCRSGITPSLGTPIAGMIYRIEPLDASEPTEGELWIAGPGLAIGYVGDPEQTDRKFVMHSGTRWYRTGDHVRVDASGECHFFGRLDQQFKLLGKLVEPEQIRRSLLRQSVIDDAMVFPVKDEQGATVSIAALVASDRRNELDVDVIRGRLARELPRWLVPATITVVESIPKTAAGKNDVGLARSLVTEGSRMDCPESDVPETDGTAAKVLHEIWTRILGHGNFGMNDSLASCGGSSLDAMEILAAARERGLSIELADLQHSSFGKCLSKSEGNVVMSTEALSRIVAATAKQSPRRRDHVPVMGGERVVMLTGATGFLGTWVLENLLRQDAGLRVVCLVRSVDRDHGISRIQSSRCRYLGPVGQRDASRIDVVCGDICRERLGLCQSQWARLTDGVSDVFHCAAEVHLLKDFEALRPANFDSILEIARFAAEGRPKSIRYASTLSVFASTNRGQRCYVEEDRLDQSADVFGGYGQSKWAAERLLWTIAPTPSPTLIRFGLLTGDTQRGIGPPQDQLGMLTRGLARLGKYPAGIEELCFDVTPVDVAARSAVRLALGNHTGSFHICGPESVTMSRWIDAMRRSGIVLDAEEPDLFFQSAGCYQENLSRDGQPAIDVAAACLALRFRTGRDDQPAKVSAWDQSCDRSLDLFLATNTRFDAREAERVLMTFDEWIPFADDALLDRMVRVMLDSDTGVVA